MRLDDGIQLTPSENSRIKAFALKHGLSQEEAVSRLARGALLVLLRLPDGRKEATAPASALVSASA